MSRLLLLAVWSVVFAFAPPVVLGQEANTAAPISAETGSEWLPDSPTPASSTFASEKLAEPKSDAADCAQPGVTDKSADARNSSNKSGGDETEQVFTRPAVRTDLRILDPRRRRVAQAPGVPLAPACAPVQIRAVQRSYTTVQHCPIVIPAPSAHANSGQWSAPISGNATLSRQQQQAPAEKPKRGFFGKLFGPLIDPFTDPVNQGLGGVSGGLGGTAEGLRGLYGPLSGLRDPLTGLAAPINDLRVPLYGLQQPLNELRNPILDLRQPMSDLIHPVEDLSKSAGGLNEPLNKLGRDMAGMRPSLQGLSKPLAGMQQPLRELVEPLRGMSAPLNQLVSPLNGLQEPLRGLQAPLTGLQQPLDKLQSEMHSLREQIDSLHSSILEIGRNITLAIVFGCSVVAYAIWTHRKVPSVVEPTIATVEQVSEETGKRKGKRGPVSTKTIIKTESLSQQGSSENQGRQSPTQDQNNPQEPSGPRPNDEPPPPSILRPPPE